ncbi:MAG: hypothetical protein RLY78_1858 [Pseudomonadota bacterium]
MRPEIGPRPIPDPSPETPRTAQRPPIHVRARATATLPDPGGAHPPPHVLAPGAAELPSCRAADGIISPLIPQQQDCDTMTTLPSGLQVDDIIAGTGAQAQVGQAVLVHYTGWLHDPAAPQGRGAKFDSSKDRGEPFEFQLGAGMVIRGWDEGVAGMLEGGTRILTIPPELGYGARGAGGVIPPNATLVFEVELLQQPERQPLQMTDTVVGEGEEARAGQRVTVHYTGWLYDDAAADHRGRKFDSSKDRNDPFRFQLGAGMVIRGWDEGVQGMKVGGTRVLVIPPELGYGRRGAGGVIPPNATLVFEVELLGV